MKKVTLYSRSDRARVGSATPASGLRRVALPNAPARPDDSASSTPVRAAWRTRLARYERPVLVIGGALFALALAAVHGSFAPVPQQLTQKDVDAAVLYTLENVPMQA